MDGVSHGQPMGQSPWLAHSLAQPVLLRLLQGRSCHVPPGQPGRMRLLPAGAGSEQLGTQEWRRTLSKLLHTQGCGTITFPWWLVPGEAEEQGSRAGLGSFCFSPGL